MPFKRVTESSRGSAKKAHLWCQAHVKQQSLTVGQVLFYLGGGSGPSFIHHDVRTFRIVCCPVTRGLPGSDLTVRLCVFAALVLLYSQNV